MSSQRDIPQWDMVVDGMVGKSLSLRRVRGEYEKKRRREIVAERKVVKRGMEEWGLENEVRLLDDVKGFWPDWWGSQTLHGVSPWDYTPGRLLGQKKRVLFLTGKLYLSRVDRIHRAEVIRLCGLPREDEYPHI
jgi:hypothetical protein